MPYGEISRWKDWSRVMSWLIVKLLYWTHQPLASRNSSTCPKFTFVETTYINWLLMILSGHLWKGACSANAGTYVSCQTKLVYNTYIFLLWGALWLPPTPYFICWRSSTFMYWNRNPFCATLLWSRAQILVGYQRTGFQQCHSLFNWTWAFVPSSVPSIIQLWEHRLTYLQNLQYLHIHFHAKWKKKVMRAWSSALENNCVPQSKPSIPGTAAHLDLPL